MAIRILAAVFAVTVGPAQVAHAETGQQYPEVPYRGELTGNASAASPDEIPAHISVVDGTVELERDGLREVAEENVPLLAGDRLRTARGRVEVLFSDGSALALDQFTDVDLMSDSLLRVQAGRIRLSIARGAAELAYRVDAAGTTWLRSAGEYRIVVDTQPIEPDVFVSVLRGTAELESGGSRTVIRTGLESKASPQHEPSLPYATNVASRDTFDRWVDDQLRHRTGARSAQYLPAELRHYGGAFDDDGEWNYQQGYGYVWYPLVATGWRPYYHGGWSFYGSFGWTWVGGGRWTWPTHHYGRWGFNTGRWFWIPGRQWGPAWISWTSAPGYLGWCPLGFDNRPVIDVTNVNVHGGDRWRGWTVLPANRFAPRVAVSRHAVSPQTLNLSDSSRFTLHASSPVRPSVAARHVEPLRAPTYSGSRYAVSRSTRSATATSIRTAPAPASVGEAQPPAAGGRVASTPRRTSNPGNQPSGTDGRPADRPSTIRTAGPRSRSNPNSAPSGGSPRSSAPTSDGGAGAPGQSSRRSMSPAPAPLPSERVFGRRSGASVSESSPAPRIPSRAIGRTRSSLGSSAPSLVRAPRIERSAAAMRSSVDRTIPIGSPRSAPLPPRPTQRSEPAGAPRVQQGAPSSGAWGESRGQARSRSR